MEGGVGGWGRGEGSIGGKDCLILKQRLEARDLCSAVHCLLEALTNYELCVTALKPDPIDLLTSFIFFVSHLNVGLHVYKIATASHEIYKCCIMAGAMCSRCELSAPLT